MPGFIRFVCVIVLGCLASMAQAATLAGNDFNKGFNDWRNDGGSLEADTDNGQYLHLVGATGRNVRVQSPEFKVGGVEKIEVRFRYKTSVKNSSENVGAWIFIPFFTNQGKLTGSEAILCPAADVWTTVIRQITVPPEAARGGLQARLQNRDGTADFDDFIISTVDAASPSATGAKVLISSANTQSTWVSQGGELGEKSADGPVFMLRGLPDKVVRFTSPIAQLDQTKYVELTFLVRTDVANSSRDVGAWAYLKFINARGQLVKGEAVVCEASKDWKEKSERFSIPDGATKVQLELRVQNRPGTAEFDKVTLQAVEKAQAALKAQPADDSLIAITTFSLEVSGSSPVLVSDKGVRLAAQSAGEPDGSRPAMGFVLPEEFCERNDLVYEISMEFVPGFSLPDDKTSRALFTLGQNMHGSQPYSFCMMLWRGESYFARLTPDPYTFKTEIIKRGMVMKKGELYSAGARFSADHVTSFWNGQELGTGNLARSFQWPKGKRFYIGRETDTLALFGADIKKFTLTVLKPKVQAVFEGGRNAGYFSGQGPHTWALQFADRQGAASTSSFRILDVNGKPISQSFAPAKRSAENHTVALPRLPYGWYQLEAMVQGTSGKSILQRSFVILPANMSRAPIHESPFGVTAEFRLDPALYDPQFVEDTLTRAAASGVRWWRVWLGWSDIQPGGPDKFEWAGLDDVVARSRAKGIELYVCVLGGTQPWQSYSSVQKAAWPLMPNAYTPRDMAQWNRMLGELAKRYRGKIKYWQIWNEPDARNGFFPYLTEAYADMLKQAASTMRAVDPDVVIGIGGFAAAFEPNRINLTKHTEKDAAWGLAEFYAQHPQSSYDVMDGHFYSVHEPGQRWDSYVPIVNGLRRMMDANGDSRKPIWNSETSMISGTPGTRGGWAHIPLLSGQEQAARLAEFYLLSLGVGVERNFWYRMTGECGYVNEDFSPKPAYAAQVILADLLRGLQADTFAGPRGAINVVTFRGASRYLAAAWPCEGTAQSQILLQSEKSITRIDMMGNRTPLASSVTHDNLKSNDIVYYESSAPISIEPVVAVSARQTGAGNASVTAEVIVRNPLAEKMVFTLDAVVENVTASQQKQIEISARGSATQAFVLDADRGTLVVRVQSSDHQVDVSDRQRLHLRRTLSFDRQGAMQIVMDQPSQVLIGGPQSYQGGEKASGEWNGLNDLSASGTLVVKDKKAVLTLRVKDDIVMAAPARKNVWDGDCVEVFIDFRSSGGKVYQVCVPAAGGKEFTSRDGPPSGWSAEIERKSDGYVLNAIFDLPDRASGFGFDIAIDDADLAGHGRKAQMIWSGTTENHRHPDGYAYLRIVR